MKKNKFKLLGVSALILISVILLCQAKSMVARHKREVDIGGVMIEGAAQAFEVIQNGAAMKKEFAITAPGENCILHKYI